MADVEGALARAAAEDGGAVFECRPRGWPPGRLLRVVPLLLLLSPLLLGWLDLARTGARLRDHAPTWTATWTYLSVRATDLPPLSVRARGPLWGLSHPLAPGLEVPWVLVAALVAAALEAVRLARYRGRRIAVTSGRLLIAQGLVRAAVREVRPLSGSARVVDGPAQASVTCDVLRPPCLARPTSLALGRLDPLDLADLARALGAPPPSPPAPRRRRWPIAVALAAPLVALALLLAVAPWRATVTISQRTLEQQQVVQLDLDGPAWGALRAKVTPWSHAEQERAFGSTTFRSWPEWLTAVALDGGPVRYDALLSDLAATLNDVEVTRRLDDRLLRRRDSRLADIDVEPVLDGDGHVKVWYSKARPHGARSPVRVTGQIVLVEGPPLLFDVTLQPDESVTLDLAELRARS